MPRLTLRTLLTSISSCLIAAGTAHAATSAISIAFNGTGLSSLRYQGVEYLGNGNFRLNAVHLRNESGVESNGSVSGACNMNAAVAKLTCSYDWGTVVAGYSVSRNNFRLSITTTNNSESTITGLYFEPLAVHFPSKPQEYDGSTPVLGSNVGSPTVLPMTYGNGALALVNEGTNPLLVGFPFAADRPGSMQLFPMRVNTASDPIYPTSLPFINRPIAPGQSDAYHVAIRFGKPGMTAYDFAPDVFARFTQLYPFRVKWTDRRPIASLILATSATGYSTNPRGWFNDRTVNVTTPAGLQAFRTRILKWADDSIAVMRDMNSQGMITWDIEGEQYRQPTSYVGDPRQFATLAPEMANIADEYFKRFRDAGFRVGVCLRPQDLQVKNGNANQVTVKDPTSLLIAKIRYAQSRWGATMFYVDSNGDPNLPISADYFARVSAAVPDVLIIPEHENLAYYSTSAPYNELRGGITSSPSLVRKLYPNAFSVINTADGDIDGHATELKRAVRQGDILMFRGWFNDPGNAKVKALYPAPPVAEAPAVDFVSPGSNEHVKSTFDINVSATSDVGVAGVQLLIDNENYGSELTHQPFTATVDSSAFTSGYHLLTAVGRDIYGTLGTVAIPVSF